MADLGTLTWAERTGGRLSGRETLALLASGMRTQVAALPPRAAAALGLRRASLASDLATIPVPDGAAARDAVEVCGELPDFLAAHSYRTYFYGMLLARHDGLTPDPEVAWVASLTHDAGLPAALEQRDATCFTLRSAAAAREVAERAGWPAQRAQLAANAVTLHLQAAVGVEHGPEARVVNGGAGVDVARARLWEIEPATRRELLARHPRDGFAPAFATLLAEHARHAPRTRCGVLCRLGGFGLIVRRSDP